MELRLPPELQRAKGPMAERLRNMDWSTTDMGHPSKWPRALVHSVSIGLHSPYPVLIFWGDSSEVIYNDAYAPILGAKAIDGEMLGKKGPTVWGEIWHEVSQMLRGTYSCGEALGSFAEDHYLELLRFDYLEEAYLGWGSSPIILEDGTVNGSFVLVTESTKKVLGERRMRTLREIGIATLRPSSIDSVCKAITGVFTKFNADIPFSAVYFFNQERDLLTLRSTSSIKAGHAAAPIQLSCEDNELWPVTEVLKGATIHVNGLQAKVGNLPGGLWPESSQSAVAMPILGPDMKPMGMLILGVNIRRSFDDDYSCFFELVVGQVTNAVIAAQEAENEKKRLVLLAEIDEAKTRFFSNVSHEFRTPLTLILGPLADLLADKTNRLPNSQQDQLSLAHRNALRLLRLVNSLLDFSRIEAGRFKAKFQPVDISSFTTDISSVFRSAYENANLGLIVDIHPMDVEVFLDTDMWEKIIYNLLSNAFKYTIEGKVTVTLQQIKNQVVLEVKDTGVGIPKQELGKVFERFHRIENAVGRSYEGTGIGLSLTEELVKLHGGRIELDSEIGVGSSFKVFIPIGYNHLPPDQVKKERKPVTVSEIGEAYVEEALRWLPSEQQPHIPPLGDPLLDIDITSRSIGELSGNVLVVDDNSDMRDYVTSLLNQRWNVAAVCNGLQALQLLKSNPSYFNIVLTDVMMPQMDGFQLLARMRDNPDIQSIPVIMLSARAGKETTIEGLQSGADDYLVKPFVAKELVARVSIHLELSKLRRELENRVKERTKELMKLNAELQESEQQFHTLAKAAPVGIIHTDTKRNAFYINEKWTEITGYDNNQGLGLGWLSLVYEEDKNDVYKQVNSGTTFKIEFRYWNPRNQQIHWVLGEDMLYVDSTGCTKGFVCTFTDVTERKRLEKERLDALVEAEQHQRKRAADAEDFKQQQSNFVDMICHEIRNPLNGIINNIDILKYNAKRAKTILEANSDKIPQCEELVERALVDVECLDAIKQCADHQRVITDDVIRASQLEANKIMLNMANFSPHNLISNIASFYTNDFVQKQIVLDLNIDVPKTMVLNSDPDRISQVLMNLVVNALKFTEKSSIRRVGISIRISESSLAHVILETTVSDTGLGMDEKEQTVLFRRFSQANLGTYHEYGGSGLGLYISKMLVQLLGGAIIVKSKKKEGTTFVFTVKCGNAVEEIERETEELRGASPIPEDRRNILVVEDNMVNQKALVRQLSVSGFICKVANNGKEAVEMFEQNHYDVIFMDVEMPIMNGFEATKEIRRIEKEREQEEQGHKSERERERVVIIGLSGNVRDVFAERGASVGMDDYVGKPYKREELLHKVSHHINSRANV